MQYELNLQDYIRIFRRRYGVILTTFILVALTVTLALNSGPPVYQATTRVLIRPPRTLASNLETLLTQTSYESPLMTEREVISSQPVAEEVVRRLHGKAIEQEVERFEELVAELRQRILTEVVPETDIINIRIQGPTAEWVTKVANLVAQVYVEFNLKEKNKQASRVRMFIDEQLKQTEGRLQASEEHVRAMRQSGKITGMALALEKQLTDLQGREMDLLSRATLKHPEVLRVRGQMAQVQRQLQALPKEELDFSQITRDVEVGQTLYSDLRQKLEEARIAEAEKIEDVTIIDAARLPTRPLRPNKPLGALAGLGVGLILSILTAVVVEDLDTSIGTIEDVEAATKLTVLGVLPSIPITGAKTVRAWWMNLPLISRLIQVEPTDEERREVQLYTFTHPDAPAAEAYRTIRTNLKLSPERKVLLVSSSGPREGKTTTVLGLGLAAAQTGAKVVLVSTDLRRPRLAKVFGIKRELGIAEVLAGAISLDQALKGFGDFAMGLGYEVAMQVHGLDRLWVLTSGHGITDFAEAVSSDAMKKLIQELRARFDLVILDSPPVLASADALVLGAQADTMVLVYEAGRTARAALLRAKTQLEEAGLKLAGIVLNNVRPEMQTYPGYYYYKYRYYEKDKEAEPAKPPATEGGPPASRSDEPAPPPAQQSAAGA